MRRISGNIGFLHRVVCKRQLSDDVADRENVQHVGVHLLFYVDESMLGYGYVDLAGIDSSTDRTVPNRKITILFIIGQGFIASLRYSKSTWGTELPVAACQLPSVRRMS